MAITRLGLLGIATGVLGAINTNAANVTEQKDLVNDGGRYTRIEYVADSYVLDDIAGFVTSSDVSEGRVTNLSLFGTPRTPQEKTSGLPESLAGEQRDSVSATGDVAIAGTSGVVLERGDTVNAIGQAFTGSLYSNAWFNEYWFNDAWFNSSWFVSAEVGPIGNAAVTEQRDTSAGDGGVLVEGTAAVTEQADTVAANATSGGDVAGDIAITEAGDDADLLGSVWVSVTGAVSESRDTVAADGEISSGGISIQTVRLTWQQVGTMTGVDIYRSSDNITFTKIASVSSTALSYWDRNIPSSGTYYYYLVGKTTTDVTITSDTQLAETVSPPPLYGTISIQGRVIANASFEVATELTLGIPTAATSGTGEFSGFSFYTVSLNNPAIDLDSFVQILNHFSVEDTSYLYTFDLNSISILQQDQDFIFINATGRVTKTDKLTGLATHQSYTDMSYSFQSSTNTFICSISTVIP